MYWVRVDNRLIHGQIIEAWLPFTGARQLVVANDELAADQLRQDIMSLAVPESVRLSFTTVAQVPGLMRSNGKEPEDALILFATCPDAMRAFDAGLAFPGLNIGNLHYGAGKKQLYEHVAVSSEDENCLEELARRGVVLDYRCVPNDPLVRKGR